jgi:ribosomal protein S18 acetylase RimI-like enzyme
MPITIRFAKSADAALIASLSRQTFLETFAEDNTAANMNKFMNEQFTVTALMNEVIDNDGIFFLALEGNEALGYIRLRESKQPDTLSDIAAIEIARIYVLQVAIGKGVGKALMLEAIKLAKAKAKQMIWLGVWEHNQRAINFYTKFGFKKFAEQPFILGDDVQTDWLMQKEL